MQNEWPHSSSSGVLAFTAAENASRQMLQSLTARGSLHSKCTGDLADMREGRLQHAVSDV